MRTIERTGEVRNDMVKQKGLCILCGVAWAALLVSLQTDALAGASGQDPGAGDRPKVALVLSGGGARGGAHVGVLAALEEAGVPVDFISGTSFGAIVGGLYAVGYSPPDLECILGDLDWAYLFDQRPDRRLLSYPNKQRTDRGLFQLKVETQGVSLPTGLQDGQRVSQLLERLTAIPLYQAGNDYDRLRIPFRAIATDLLHGRVLTFSSGPLSTALRASMAVPGIFTPVEHEGTLLVDGGVLDNLPVDAALEWGADIIIAVDVSTPLRSSKDEFGSLVDVLDQTISLHIEESLQVSRKLADVLIQPDLEGFTSLDFGKAGQLIPLGRTAALDQMPAIRQLLVDKGISLPGRPPRGSLLPADFDPESFAYSPSPVPIQSVGVSGAEKYPPETVLKHTRIRGGQSASIGEIDRDVSAIYGSDLYESAGFRLQRGQPALTFEVNEAARTRLGLGLRYDKDYQFTGAFELLSRQVAGGRFDFLSRVLVGNVQQVHLALDGGSYSGRRFFASTFFQFRSFDRLLFAGEEQRGDFEDQRIMWGIGLNRLIGRSGRVEVGYRLERVDAARGLGAFRQASPEVLAGLSAAWRWDSFDEADFPSRGLRVHFQFDWRDRSLGGDFSFLRWSAEAEQRFQVLERGTLGAGLSWKVIDGGAPFYELLYSGSRRYFDFVADPFIGLRRDERVSKQRLILDLSYRHRLKSFQLGVVQNAYLEGIYNGGFFSLPDSRDLSGPLHGFGFGASVHVRFLGPVRVLLGKTDETGWTSYFSIGYRF